MGEIKERNEKDGREINVTKPNKIKSKNIKVNDKNKEFNVIQQNMQKQG